MFMDLVKSYDLKARLDNFKSPTLIVQGRQDPIGESAAYQTKEMLPQDKIEFIERCRHFPWIEQSEKFFLVIRDFLDNVK